MKLIRHTETNEFKNSDACIAIEYPLKASDINIAIVKINGRYPESGRVMNEQCKEIGFVMEGEGKVIIEGQEVALQKGDAVLIEAKERISWEGSLTMLMSCTPAWSPEQHTLISE